MCVYAVFSGRSLSAIGAEGIVCFGRIIFLKKRRICP